MDDLFAPEMTPQDIANDLSDLYELCRDARLAVISALDPYMLPNEQELKLLLRRPLEEITKNISLLTQGGNEWMVELARNNADDGARFATPANELPLADTVRPDVVPAIAIEAEEVTPVEIVMSEPTSVDLDYIWGAEPPF